MPDIFKTIFSFSSKGNSVAVINLKFVLGKKQVVLVEKEKPFCITSIFLCFSCNFKKHFISPVQENLN